MKKGLTILILLMGSGMVLGEDVAMIIAHNGFNRTEYETPRGVFETEGHTVTVASSSLEEAVSMDGTLRVEPDILIGSLAVQDYDALIFVGGSGADEYWSDPISHSICRDAVNQHKVLSAICIAPVTLACSDVLMGKKATVFPSPACIDSLTAHGAEYTGRDVEEDGGIITADGPPSAQKFANAICALLQAEAVSEWETPISSPIFITHTNPLTDFTFSFQLPSQTWVSLSIYDSQGRLIKTLAKGVYTKGIHSIPWNASKDRVSSGIYFLRLETKGASISKKLVIM